MVQLMNEQSLQESFFTRTENVNFFDKNANFAITIRISSRNHVAQRKNASDKKCKQKVEPHFHRWICVVLWSRVIADRFRPANDCYCRWHHYVRYSTMAILWCVFCDLQIWNERNENALIKKHQAVGWVSIHCRLIQCYNNNAIWKHTQSVWKMRG